MDNGWCHLQVKQKMKEQMQLHHKFLLVKKMKLLAKREFVIIKIS